MLYCFFSCLITLIRTSNTILNSSGKIGHPCLALDFKGNASSFCLFSMILAALVIFRYVILIPSLRVFSIKCCWILLKAFSACIEIIMWFLSVVLFMWWILFTDCPMSRCCVALHSRDEAALIVMDKLFDMLLDLVCQYFTEDLLRCSSWLLAWSFLL